MSNSADATALALDQNLAVSAGAGAGKTHNLVTLCLHLLGGARKGGTPIPTERLFMVTFTEKASAEMRERLRRRLDSLARGQDGGEELLRSSFERHGQPFPARSFWRRVRDELGDATIGTFHALCASMLRRAPAGGGTVPDFSLLDEREAQALIRDCAPEKTRIEDGAIDAMLRGAGNRTKVGAATGTHQRFMHDFADSGMRVIEKLD